MLKYFFKYMVYAIILSLAVVFILLTVNDKAYPQNREINLPNSGDSFADSIIFCSALWIILAVIIIAIFTSIAKNEKHKEWNQFIREGKIK